jgi:hypothetical protein
MNVTVSGHGSTAGRRVIPFLLPRRRAPAKWAFALFKFYALHSTSSHTFYPFAPAVAAVDFSQILEEMEGSGLHVITRAGNPAKPTEQKRASAALAETVVLMWPAGLPPAEASAQQAAVLAALKTAGGVVGQKVVVQSAGEDAAQFDAVKVRTALQSVL